MSRHQVWEYTIRYMGFETIRTNGKDEEEIKANTAETLKKVKNEAPSDLEALTKGLQELIAKGGNPKAIESIQKQIDELRDVVGGAEGEVK